MSSPQDLGQVLRDIQKRQRKRGRVCPWFRGVRVTDLDETASQIRTSSQEPSGESSAEDPPTVGQGVER